MNKYNFSISANVIILVLFTIIVSSISCKKEDNTNPYDTVNYNYNNISSAEPDSNSITGLHKNIFSRRCANPGCHDGTFEPDFRTVQSTYSTLVYMPCNKLTVDSLNFFTLRVTPGDFQHSFLYERLTTATSDYMPSNSVRLSDSEIGHIKTWILNGAKDVNGNSAVKPDLPPNILGFLAADASFIRIDTIRSGNISYNPFITASNSQMYLLIQALDTADGSSATDPSLFTSHKIKFSLIKDDFSSALTVNCNWMSPLNYPVWQTVVNTSQWSSGTTVYFRVYINDGFQAVDAEFPRTSSPDYYKTYYAFYIQ